MPDKRIRNKTEAQQLLLSRQSQDLMELQDEFFTRWLTNSVPVGWDQMEVEDPVEPHKTKVTLRLDDEMLKWFRKLGPGCQARINQVLRIYWRGLRMGLVQSHYSPEVYAKMLADRQRGSCKQGMVGFLTEGNFEPSLLNNSTPIIHR